MLSFLGCLVWILEEIQAFFLATCIESTDLYVSISKSGFSDLFCKSSIITPINSNSIGVLQQFFFPNKHFIKQVISTCVRPVFYNMLNQGSIVTGLLNSC